MREAQKVPRAVGGFALRECSKGKPPGGFALRECSKGKPPGDFALRKCSKGKPSGGFALRECSKGKPPGGFALRECSKGKPPGGVKSAVSSKQECASVSDGDVGAYRCVTIFNVGLGQDKIDNISDMLWVIVAIARTLFDNNIYMEKEGN